MKEIIAMTEQECFSYISENEGRHYVIRIHNGSDKKLYDRFDRTENLIEKIDVSFDDDECKDGVEFSFNIAEKIIRFCERQRDADTIIITCEDELTRAYNVKSALEDCYKLDYEPYEFDKMCTVARRIKLKYQESRHWLINVLSPMDYCKKIIEYTVEQLREFISGRDDWYEPLDFMSARQCSVYLKNGTYFMYDLDMLYVSFGNTVIPDIYEIEYVVFYGVPEFTTRDSFDNDTDYIYDSKYRIINNSHGKFCYDSINGIIPEKEQKLPEKYNDYRMLQRVWCEFPTTGSGRYIWYPPEMEQAFAGMIAAEDYLSDETGYKPRFIDIPLFHPDDAPIYSKEFLNVLDIVLNTIELAGISQLNELERMCAYAAYIYTGMLRHCGHCENLSLVHEIFCEVFKGSEQLPQFDKLWKIGECEPEISNNPIDMLCIAIYSLMVTVRPLEGQQIPSGTYKKSLQKAFALTKGCPELNNAIIMAGAFAGIYCQATD